MARTPRQPAYRKHSTRDLALVEIDGKRIYLGKHGTPESRQQYDRVIAEWLANGRKMPVAPEDVTIAELCAAFMRHAKVHYRTADGEPSSRIWNVNRVVKAMLAIYASLPVAEFGPANLKTIRAKLVRDGLCRRTVNQDVSTLKAIFKWAVAEGMIPASVYGALQCVEGLKRGRTEARDPERKKPVPDANIEAIRPYVSRQVIALIDLQLLTGARPGELVGLRPIDIDTSAPIWTVTPEKHKTAHRGRERVLYFGPKAQTVLREFMQDRAVHKPMFSPREAMAEFAAKCEIHRRENQKPNRRKSKRTLGDVYTVGAYRHAITRGIEHANAEEDRKTEIPKWSPHLLRHNAATLIRKQYGIETARVILGHASLEVAEIYAERDEEHAREVIAKIG